MFAGNNACVDTIQAFTNRICVGLQIFATDASARRLIIITARYNPETNNVCRNCVSQENRRKFYINSMWKIYMSSEWNKQIVEMQENILIICNLYFRKNTNPTRMTSTPFLADFEGTLGIRCESLHEAPGASKNRKLMISDNIVALCNSAALLNLIGNPVRLCYCSCVCASRFDEIVIS